MAEISSSMKSSAERTSEMTRTVQGPDAALVYVFPLVKVILPVCGSHSKPCPSTVSRTGPAASKVKTASPGTGSYNWLDRIAEFLQAFH